MSSRIGPVRPTGERQRLYTDKHERERFDDMAAIFSLLTATERLENMWARRGATPQQDYEMQCDRLIKQYKTLAATGNAVPDLRRFIAEYDCKANLAYARLEEGVPATVLGRNKNVYKYVMNCTSMFYHLSDTIVMEQTGVDVLLPELTTLNRNLETIKRMAPHSNYDFNQKINAWSQRLNEMPAHKKLSNEDAAQLKLDLDTSFQEFERAFND